jgi:hypothetical protein
MSYNQEFFSEYKNYLQEPQVRKTHDTMFRLFCDIFPQWKYPLNVMDLGCGQCCEYHDRGWHSGYIGLDLDPIRRPTMMQCDYTKVSLDEVKLFAVFPVHAFVSLFSTECCMHPVDKYAFYRKLFRETDVQMGLVSGFYYKNRIKQEQVEETGEIVSYQTIEPQQDYQCPEFIELRSYFNVPSKMFGPDVVEVWKVLIKT